MSGLRHKQFVLPSDSPH